MPASTARTLFVIGIAGLLWLDRDRKSHTSPAVWIAVAWMFFGSSRGVTLWFGGQTPTELDQYVDGSPVDRLLLSGLQLAGMLVLIIRGRKSGSILRSNGPLLLFFAYCALSMVWSDFAFVAFKRLIKALGNVTMVMVLLTDADPLSAVKRAFARTGFLLIPLSVLLIKYYPDLGRQYSRWTWMPSYIGVSTDKNGLGVLTLVFGLAALWNFMEAWREDTRSERLERAAAHAAVVGLALFLFHMANSSTSLGCFLLGGMVLLGMTVSKIERPAALNFIVGSAVVVGVFGYLFLDASTYVIEALGRDSTLTGRTELWAELQRMPINSWIGVGFESFWLGDRAQYFWDKYWWHPNEAHNGYLEMYLDLGWLGVGMLVVLIVSGYRNIVREYQLQPQLGRIRLAFLLVAPVYCITEAAFKLMNPVWIAFLLASTALPILAKAGDAKASLASLTTPTPPGKPTSPSIGSPKPLSRPAPVSSAWSAAYGRAPSPPPFRSAR